MYRILSAKSQVHFALRGSRCYSLDQALQELIVASLALADERGIDTQALRYGADRQYRTERYGTEP